MTSSPKRITPEDREGPERLVRLIEEKMNRADYEIRDISDREVVG